MSAAETHKDSDEKIAKFIQSGRAEAFGIIVERYEAKLKRYGTNFLSSHEDIEDIVQEIFIKAYENIQSFDPLRRFSPWIYRIAHNAFVNKLRKSSREKWSFMDLDTLTAHDESEEGEEHDRDEIKRMIDRALKKIDAKYREVLTLYYIEDLSYKEISDVLEVPTSTVGVRLSRGKDALRKAYKN